MKVRLEKKNDDEAVDNTETGQDSVTSMPDWSDSFPRHCHVSSNLSTSITNDTSIYRYIELRQTLVTLARVYYVLVCVTVSSCSSNKLLLPTAVVTPLRETVRT